MVGMRGFEPPTPASRTLCSTRLSHIPTCVRFRPCRGRLNESAINKCSCRQSQAQKGGWSAPQHHRLHLAFARSGTAAGEILPSCQITSITVDISTEHVPPAGSDARPQSSRRAGQRTIKPRTFRSLAHLLHGPVTNRAFMVFAQKTTLASLSRLQRRS